MYYNQQSAISNQQSAISNQQSAISKKIGNSKLFIKYAAFTTLELLIAISIITIIAAIATPAVKTIILNKRITATTDDIVSALNFARTSSLNKDFVVVCNADSGHSNKCLNTQEWQGNINVAYGQKNTANMPTEPDYEDLPMTYIHNHQSIGGGVSYMPQFEGGVRMVYQIYKIQDADNYFDQWIDCLDNMKNLAGFDPKIFYPNYDKTGSCPSLVDDNRQNHCYRTEQAISPCKSEHRSCVNAKTPYPDGCIPHYINYDEELVTKDDLEHYNKMVLPIKKDNNRNISRTEEYKAKQIFIAKFKAKHGVDLTDFDTKYKNMDPSIDVYGNLYSAEFKEIFARNKAKKDKYEQELAASGDSDYILKQVLYTYPIAKNVSAKIKYSKQLIYTAHRLIEDGGYSQNRELYTGTGTDDYFDQITIYDERGEYSATSRLICINNVGLITVKKGNQTCD